MKYSIVLVIGIGFLSLLSCGKSSKSTQDQPTVDSSQQMVNDTMPRPMMIKVTPRDFREMMIGVPFAFDEKYIKENKIKQVKFVQNIVADGKNIDNYEQVSWTFNTEGQVTRYLWEKSGDKIKKDTLIYQSGLLVQSNLIMYLRGPEPDPTYYTYSNGKLISTKNEIAEGITENIQYKYSEGRLTEEKNDMRDRRTTYKYKGDTLIGYVQKDPYGTNEVTYVYDAKGRLILIKNDGEYKFEYPIVYNVNGQIKEMKWIENGNPFVDFFFEFDASGKLVTIKNKGYSAAWHEAETLIFSYEYY